MLMCARSYIVIVICLASIHHFYWEICLLVNNAYKICDLRETLVVSYYANIYVIMIIPKCEHTFLCSIYYYRLIDQSLNSKEKYTHTTGSQRPKRTIRS